MKHANNSRDDLYTMLHYVQQIDPDKVGFVYISLGSKLNREEIYVEGKCVKSNAYYQMVPEYCRSSYKEKLNIIFIIDTFKGTELNQHRSAMREFTTGINKIFLINFKIEDDTIIHLQTFIKMLADIFVYMNDDQFMFCNYIKFSNSPNTMEINTLELIKQKLIPVLDDTKFKNSYYEWFGYHSGLYDFIYNKNKFSHMLNHSSNVNKLMDALNNNAILTNETIELSKSVYGIKYFDNGYSPAIPSVFDNLIL